ncbi:MAG: hypothetical protein Q8N94_00165 [Methanoregula sp.]|nr:hypothetical protein [Methanoregula sp.]
MSTYSRLELWLSIFLVILFLIPVGVIIFVSEESPYHQVSGEPVNEAALATGITVASVKDTTWNLPGATGGKTYVLTDNSGEVVTVSTQTFDSGEAREAAIRLYNAHPVGRGKPVGSLVVLGEHLVYVTPANSDILTRLAPELKKKISP